MSVIVRDFEPRDQMVVRELILAGMRERWGDEFDPDANKDTDDLAATYVAHGGEVVVVEVNGSVAGTVTVMPEHDGAARVLRLSVDRNHRRNGLGRMLIAESVARAKRRGFETLRVNTDAAWSEAINLYRSCGFELERRDSVSRFVMSLEPTSDR